VWSKKHGEYVDFRSLRGAQAMSAFVLKLVQKLPQEIGRSFSARDFIGLSTIGGMAIGAALGVHESIPEFGELGGAIAASILGGGIGGGVGSVTGLFLLEKYRENSDHYFAQKGIIDPNRPLPISDK
jgi:hypothetical protein